MAQDFLNHKLSSFAFSPASRFAICLKIAVGYILIYINKLSHTCGANTWFIINLFLFAKHAPRSAKFTRQ